MTHRVVGAALLASLCIACASPDTGFIAANAQAHVTMLAGTIGSRPAGSEANRRARAYLVDEFRRLGMDVRVQEVDASRPELGLTGHVANIVATSSGSTSDAIALVAHYDSIPDGPGAGDDAFGAAVALEAARVLGASGMRHSLMVLLTDGEENGLLGAAGAMADPAIRDRIAAYLNIEAAGASGVPMLFEAGPGNQWLTDTWARHATHPRGQSFAVEIYKRTPNDTDFTILKNAGIPGLNFALIGDGSAYHTDRDSAARLDPESIKAAGENTIAIVRGLDGLDLRQRTTEDATYFEVAGVAAVAYGPRAAQWTGIAAMALGLFAWVRMVLAAARATGTLRFVLSFIWTVAGAISVAATMVGAMWLLRAVREVYHPWYAHPGRAAAFMTMAGLSAGWLLSRACARLPSSWRGDQHPAALWAVALPVWIAAAAVTLWSAPAAAHLTTLPLLAAGALLSVAPRAVRLASVITLVVGACIWLQIAIDLISYANALLGRLPIVAPVWAFPAILIIAGLFLVPPIVSIVTSRFATGSRWLTAVCAVGLALTGALAYFAEGYSDRHPLRRIVRFVQDDASKTARWEVGGVESDLDIDSSSALEWVRGPGDSGDRLVPPLPQPFTFHATTTPVVMPAAITASSAAVAEGVALVVSVHPHHPSSAVSLLLPAGVLPFSANLPGRIANGRWRSTFVAPPADGVTWRVVLPAAAALGETRIVVQTAVLPGRAGQESPDRLPVWLSSVRTAWTARAVYVTAMPRSLTGHRSAG